MALLKDKMYNYLLSSCIDIKQKFGSEHRRNTQRKKANRRLLVYFLSFLYVDYHSAYCTVSCLCVQCLMRCLSEMSCALTRSTWHPQIHARYHVYCTWGQTRCCLIIWSMSSDESNAVWRTEPISCVDEGGSRTVTECPERVVWIKETQNGPDSVSLACCPGLSTPLFSFRPNWAGLKADRWLSTYRQTNIIYTTSIQKQVARFWGGGTVAWLTTRHSCI